MITVVARCIPTLLLAAGVAGCSGPTGSNANTSVSSTPSHLVTGEDIQQVLPATDYLQSLFTDPVAADPENARFGIKTMGSNNSDNLKSGPRECLGILPPGPEWSVYQQFHPTQYVIATWDVDLLGAHSTSDVLPEGPVGVWTSALAFDNTESATSAFDNSTTNWASCDGTFVTVYQPTPPDSSELRLTASITEVRAEDELLSATVPLNLNGSGAQVFARALGIRGNCIVETTVMYTTGTGPEAVEIARHMMDTISDLG